MRFFQGLPIVLLLASGCTTRLSSPPITSKPATTAPDGALLILPENTQITFIGSAVANSHEGTFTRFSGWLRCPTANPVDAHLLVEIKTDSVFTKIDLLTRHLKEEDFFDVAKYPTATLVSTQIQPDGQDYLITGNLTLHGVTRSISFPARFHIEPKTIDLQATMVIRQSDFKMQSVKTTTDQVPVRVVAHILKP